MCLSGSLKTPKAKAKSKSKGKSKSKFKYQSKSQSKFESKSQSKSQSKSVTNEKDIMVILSSSDEEDNDIEVTTARQNSRYKKKNYDKDDTEYLPNETSSARKRKIRKKSSNSQTGKTKNRSTKGTGTTKNRKETKSERMKNNQIIKPKFSTNSKTVKNNNQLITVDFHNMPIQKKSRMEILLMTPRQQMQEYGCVLEIENYERVKGGPETPNAHFNSFHPPTNTVLLPIKTSSMTARKPFKRKSALPLEQYSNNQNGPSPVRRLNGQQFASRSNKIGGTISAIKQECRQVYDIETGQEYSEPVVIQHPAIPAIKMEPLTNINNNNNNNNNNNINNNFVPEIEQEQEMQLNMNINNNNNENNENNENNDNNDNNDNNENNQNNQNNENNENNENNSNIEESDDARRKMFRNSKNSGRTRRLHLTHEWCKSMPLIIEIRPVVMTHKARVNSISRKHHKPYFFTINKIYLAFRNDNDKECKIIFDLYDRTRHQYPDKTIWTTELDGNDNEIKKEIQYSSTNAIIVHNLELIYLTCSDYSKNISDYIKGLNLRGLPSIDYWGARICEQLSRADVLRHDYKFLSRYSKIFFNIEKHILSTKALRPDFLENAEISKFNSKNLQLSYNWQLNDAIAQASGGYVLRDTSNFTRSKIQQQQSELCQIFGYNKFSDNIFFFFCVCVCIWLVSDWLAYDCIVYFKQCFIKFT